jgi:hypothetical protein
MRNWGKNSHGDTEERNRRVKEVRKQRWRIICCAVKSGGETPEPPSKTRVGHPAAGEMAAKVKGWKGARV